jgi:cell division transport system permease protein
MIGPIRHILREFWRSVSHHRALCLASVLSMASILLLFLLYLMLLQSVDRYTENLEARGEVTVFLDEGLGTSDVRDLKAKLQGIAGVDSVRYVSKEEAWESLRADLADEALLQAVGGNPLPASFVLSPGPGHRGADAVREIARQAETMPHVEDVRYAGEWVLRAEQLTGTLRQLGAALGLIVLLAVLFVVGATTRLAVQARLESLHLVRSLGGGFLFTHAPYLFEGFALAFLSSLLTIYVARLVHDTLAGGLFEVGFLSVATLAQFTGVSGLLGLLGSWIAVATLPKRWVL